MDRRSFIRGATSAAVLPVIPFAESGLVLASPLSKTIDATWVKLDASRCVSVTWGGSRAETKWETPVEVWRLEFSTPKCTRWAGYNAI